MLCGGANAEEGGGWIELHPEADWNNFSEDELRTFVGVVEHQPEGDQISFVMRYNPFKLRRTEPEGVLDIYGRSEKLKQFIGKRVEIRGKLEMLRVEGRQFIEIWPVKVRLAP